MTRHRPNRARELIQTEIAELLLCQMKSQRWILATASRVAVSLKLRHACVYTGYSGFARAEGFVCNQLGRRLKLPTLLELAFKSDTAIAYGVHIARFLHALRPRRYRNPRKSDSAHV